MVLGKMKDVASTYLGKPVTKAVVTVPGAAALHPQPTHSCQLFVA